MIGRHIIHFVDAARIGSELRPICGAWGEEIVWTTLRDVATCSDCRRAARRAETSGVRKLVPILSAAPGGPSHH